MNMPIDQLLDECLDQIHQGQSLESCLADHPQEAENLRPLLETAAALRTATVQHSTRRAFLQGQARMFAAIDREFPQKPVSEGAFSRYSVRILTWITGKETIDMKLATRLTVAFILVLVVIAGLGTTAVSARNALPGDLLYSLKASAQNAQLMLTWDAQARQALEQHFQEEYRHEVHMLMQDGRQAPVRFVGKLDAMNNNLWVVGGLPVTVDPATKITGNLQLGDLVQVEAAVQKDGSILVSSLALSSAGHHPEEQHMTPAHTPEHTPMHTAEPEHTQDNREHAVPKATALPTQTLERSADRSATPAPTASPIHHTEPVHQDNGGSCTNCGGPSDGSSGGHDGGHEDKHDSGHK
jgi:hypothetical protein